MFLKRFKLKAFLDFDNIEIEFYRVFLTAFDVEFNDFSNFT